MGGKEESFLIEMFYKAKILPTAVSDKIAPMRTDTQSSQIKHKIISKTHVAD